MSKQLDIQSRSGQYSVIFVENIQGILSAYDREETQFIIDKKVYELYREMFEPCLLNAKITFIEASEENKNLDRMTYYISELVKNQVRLNHKLVAIGGGITQDITCFIASTLFRGMQWDFFPTTLLAQADSCIGSKSSINVGGFKNLVGTFYPPMKIYLAVNFLKTLEKCDVQSGVGEILKVHMIKGIRQFENCLGQYDQMMRDPSLLEGFIFHSLMYKREKIEADELDKNIRNVMNYGHSYGHAIESATNFRIPHGIAVTIGMDMANYQSSRMHRISSNKFSKWHEVLKKNYQQYRNEKIDLDKFLSAIAKDKKNTGIDLQLILVSEKNDIEKIKVISDDSFKENCQTFLCDFFKERP